MQKQPGFVALQRSRLAVLQRKSAWIS